jgi:hypothetical protein
MSPKSLAFVIFVLLKTTAFTYPDGAEKTFLDGTDVISMQ